MTSLLTNNKTKPQKYPMRQGEIEKLFWVMKLQQKNLVGKQHIRCKKDY